MMKRDECLKVLAGRLPEDQIVVAAYTTAFEWIAIRPNPLNYISSGAMGLTAPHALGFALGMPDRRIVLLDGDGSLLMNLGCLVTIAEAAPTSLAVRIVCYEEGSFHGFGGQYHASDQRGEAFDLVVSEQGIGRDPEVEEQLPFLLNGDAHTTYYPLPYWLDARGFGGWFDTPRRVHVDLCAASTEDAEFEIILGEMRARLGTSP